MVMIIIMNVNVNTQLFQINDHYLLNLMIMKIKFKMTTATDLKIITIPTPRASQ